MENLNTKSKEEKPKEDPFYIKLAKHLLEQEQKDGEPMDIWRKRALAGAVALAAVLKAYTLMK